MHNLDIVRAVKLLGYGLLVWGREISRTGRLYRYVKVEQYPCRCCKSRQHVHEFFF